MFSFLHYNALRPNQEPQILSLCFLICFFDSQSDGNDLHGSQESRFQLKTFFLFYSRRNVTNHGLSVSKLTAHFNLWVNYPFNSGQERTTNRNVHSEIPTSAFNFPKLFFFYFHRRKQVTHVWQDMRVNDGILTGLLSWTISLRRLAKLLTTVL